MPEPTIAFRGTDLKSILAQAREYVLHHGRPRLSPRGQTFSTAGIELIWEQPADTEAVYWGWDQVDTQYYYRSFVEKRPGNLPERLAAPGETLFPYTYAARSRFWDGGWGYVRAVVEATRALDVKLPSILASSAAFRAYLEAAGERVHLQPLLAVWDWLGAARLQSFLDAPETLAGLLEHSRLDQLEIVIREIERVPLSRRAITASFVYPTLDHRFSPLQSVPPYQHFQLLPSAADEPLSSFHIHRSLDASDGVQLDFYHDLRWLSEACQRLGRAPGAITVVASDFHVYISSIDAESHDIQDWLARVTDAYPAGQGQAKEWLARPPYCQYYEQVYARIS
jgi:hypothetical protein